MVIPGVMVEEGMPAEGTDGEGEPEAVEPPQPAVVASTGRRREGAKATQEESGTDDEGVGDLQVSPNCTGSACGRS